MAQRPSDAEDLARWTSIDDFLERQLLPKDPVLDSVLAAGRSAGLPDIQVSPLQGALLHLLTRAVRAKFALEVGTLAGYSATQIARALPKDGRLLTLEVDPRHAMVARDNFRAAGVDDLVEIRLGPASESLRKIASEGREPFDLVFLDADKPSTSDYVEQTIPLLRVGGLLLIDNVVRRGDVMDPGNPDPNVIGTREALGRISRDPRLTTTVVQTVGRKGHDGFLYGIRS